MCFACFVFDFLFWLFKTGEKVVNLPTLTLNKFKENMVVKTDKGTEVATDMVLLCTGIKVNSSAYNSAFSKPFPTLSPLPALGNKPNSYNFSVSISDLCLHCPSALPYILETSYIYSLLMLVPC